MTDASLEAYLERTRRASRIAGILGTIGMVGVGTSYFIFVIGKLSGSQQMTNFGSWDGLLHRNFLIVFGASNILTAFSSLLSSFAGAVYGDNAKAMPELNSGMIGFAIGLLLIAMGSVAFNLAL